MFKKILAILIATLFMLAGCTGHNSGETATPHLNPLSVQNEDGDIIYFGMSRTAAEEILGEGELTAPNMYAYQEGSFLLLYRDDTVVLIIVPEVGWRSPGGAAVDMMRNDLHNLYALTHEFINDDNGGHNGGTGGMIYDEQLNILPPIDSPLVEAEWAFIIDFAYSNDLEIVIGFVIGDRQAAITFS
ncbi:MAG: hypothetical protein FWD03_10435 [Defluviitaleaceae bacterium]|nr:hypothetical protein [Defluviitaleaceae bacterium]